MNSTQGSCRSGGRGIDVDGFGRSADSSKLVGSEESIENSSFVLVDVPMYYVKILYKGRFDIQHSVVA